MRRDIAALGDPWHPTILWYAKAVSAMSRRPVTDRTGWRYLAAIHGVGRSRDGRLSDWIAAGVVDAGEQLPTEGERRRTWDQCQHAGWYFLPWHRGYLWAFESVVARTVRDLGGPNDWSLPYWNYFDDSNPAARRIPQAFIDGTLPDGTPNPLSAPPRSEAEALGPTADIPVDITLSAMDSQRFTSAPGTLEFGGGRTDFLHLGGSGSGALEFDPHNLVHGMVGGDRGFMSNPDFAALDPIFWLHHCNVDRLWAAWLTRSENVQESGGAWGDGPFPRRFEMPDASGQLAVFTPADTLPGGALAPVYDDLENGTGAATVVANVDFREDGTLTAKLSNAPPPEPALLGSSMSTVTAGVTAGTARVLLTDEGATIAASPSPKRVFLNLGNVRGSVPTGVLRIYLGLPATTNHGAIEPEEVKTVSLFGLAKASEPDGPHAGNGLGISIDITDAARSLVDRTQVGLDELEVRIEHPSAARTGDITVESITVVSQPAE